MEKSNLLINKLSLDNTYRLDKYYLQLIHAKKIATIVNDKEMVKWCDSYLPLVERIMLKCKNVDEKEQDDVLIPIGKNFYKVGNLKPMLLNIEKTIIEYLGKIQIKGIKIPELVIPDELKGVFSELMM